MKIKILKKLIRQLYTKNDKNYISGTIIQNLLQNGVYLPITNSSPSLNSLKLLMNDVVINKRKMILEFGSGISTILFSRLLYKNNINGTIVSIDNDNDWIQTLKDILKKDGLINYVEFIHAPLCQNSNIKSLNNLLWYDEKILNNHIRDKKFDLVFVDGPVAYKKNIELSRYPALPFIYKNLNKNFSFFLDDVDRNGEKKILSLWEKEYKTKFKILNKKLGLSSQGDLYNIF